MKHLNTGKYVEKQFTVFDFKYFILRYKLVVAEAIVEYLKPIQENIARYMSNPDYLTDVLTQGNGKAQEIASYTWEEIQCRLGLKNMMNNKNILKMNKNC